MSNEPQFPETLYYLMDGRATYDVDRAIVLECCSSLEEAYEDWQDYGGDTCIVDAKTWELINCLLWVK